MIQTFAARSPSTCALGERLHSIFAFVISIREVLDPTVQTVAIRDRYMAISYWRIETRSWNIS